MPNTEQLLTAAEAAERFQVHPETIRRWTREGKLPAVVFPSGRKRYRVSDVEALLSVPSVQQAS